MRKDWFLVQSTFREVVKPNAVVGVLSQIVNSLGRGVRGSEGWKW